MGRRKVACILVAAVLTVLNIWLANYVVKPMKMRKVLADAEMVSNKANQVNKHRISGVHVVAVENVHSVQHLQEAGILSLNVAVPGQEGHQSPTKVLQGHLSSADPQSLIKEPERHNDKSSSFQHNKELVSLDINNNPSNHDHQVLPGNVNQPLPGPNYNAGVHGSSLGNGKFIFRSGLGNLHGGPKTNNIQQKLSEDVNLEKLKLSFEALKNTLRKNISDRIPLSKPNFFGVDRYDQNAGSIMLKNNSYYGDTELADPSGQILFSNDNQGQQVHSSNNLILNALQDHLRPSLNAAFHLPQTEDFNALEDLANAMNCLSLDKLTPEKAKMVRPILSEILQRLQELHQHQQQQRQQQQQQQPHPLQQPGPDALTNFNAGQMISPGDHGSLLNKQILENMIQNIARDNDVIGNIEEDKILRNILRDIDTGKLPIAEMGQVQNPEMDKSLAFDQNSGEHLEQGRERTL